MLKKSLRGAGHAARQVLVRRSGDSPPEATWRDSAGIRTKMLSALALMAVPAIGAGAAVAVITPIAAKTNPLARVAEFSF